eukprot:7705564-Alexandrium_andersonii.AAC.1
MASYLQEPASPDDEFECAACQNTVREIYLATDDDRVPGLYAGFPSVSYTHLTLPTICSV